MKFLSASACFSFSVLTILLASKLWLMASSWCTFYPQGELLPSILEILVISHGYTSTRTFPYRKLPASPLIKLQGIELCNFLSENT